MSPRLRELDRVLQEAAALARSERPSMRPELKGDGSLVTTVDRAVETFLREALPQVVPNVGFWGEEFGHDETDATSRWLVDPIDGTSNFTYGSPLWGVSICLIEDGVLTLGGVALPDLNETYLGELGGGAFLNGNPLSPIPPGPVKPEQLLSYGETLLVQYGPDAFPGKMRLGGAFVIDGCFVLSQRFRGMVARRERLYDVAAIVVMARELGADIRYADGQPFDEAVLAKGGKIDRAWVIFPQDSDFSLP
ncbi:inositol monophosphatase family protein [bacterium]|nr:MAG: inositol monophosphatase family protein [bacterium]